MGFFITILEGPSATSATPIIAISDPLLVEMLGEKMSERMANKPPGELRRRLTKTAAEILRVDEEEDHL